MPLPGGGAWGGSGNSALSPACASAGEQAQFKPIATNETDRIVLMSVHLVERTAVIGGSSEDFLSIRQCDGAGVHGEAPILGAIPFDADVVAGLEAGFLLAAPGQGVRVTGFARPMAHDAVLVFGFDVEIYVRVHPVQLGDHAGKRDGLLLVILSREGMMRPCRQRG